MNSLVREVAEKAFIAGTYKKNIHYTFRKDADPREFAMVKSLAGSPGMCAWMIQQCHHRAGVQMHVSKEVSDDLQATDFSDAAKIENVPWISPVVELYFEDPILPTLLVMKTHPDQIQSWLPQIEVGLEGCEFITGLMQEGSNEMESKFLSVQLKPSMYEDFLQDAVVPDMGSGLLSTGLSEQDNSAMCYMIHLALKVFAFASIPIYKPVPIGRKQMTHGGKPDVKGRPVRPAFRASYLPTVIHKSINVDNSGEFREFRGRRGHIRWYHDERYVYRKDTWDFMQPVRDPHTGKYPPAKTFKVRKA